MRSFITPTRDPKTRASSFQRMLADNGITCSMSRAGNVWDRAIGTPWVRGTMARSAMESFFSTLKTERTARKVYRTRNEARADVFDYIERFYNPRRRHSKLGYLSPMEFEARAALANLLSTKPAAAQSARTGCSSIRSPRAA